MIYIYVITMISKKFTQKCLRRPSSTVIGKSCAPMHRLVHNVTNSSLETAKSVTDAVSMEDQIKAEKSFQGGSLTEKFRAPNTIKLDSKSKYECIGNFSNEFLQFFSRLSQLSNVPTEAKNLQTKVRRNQVNIEMLSSSEYQHLFGKDQISKNSANKEVRAQKHLSENGLLEKVAPAMPNFYVPQPNLQGENIEEHFYNIAEVQSAPYRQLLFHISKVAIPIAPTRWSINPGWTKYETGKESYTVPFPDEDALVFDVEVCMKLGKGPTLATAVSATSWYSWVSESLATVLAGETRSDKTTERRRFTPTDFIPLESHPLQVAPTVGKNVVPKVIIGHNVSYDRARVKEQYWLQGSGLRFVDTLSLHVAVSGVSSYQKTQLSTGTSTVQDQKLEMDVDFDDIWRNKSSLNNLNDVHKLYCGGDDLDKSSRDVFVSGTLTDVADKFTDLMSYCAADVRATHEVIAKLFPVFLERFPHPATFAGMLELSTAYLPVNQSWNRYLRDATETHDDLEAEARFLLAKQANNACSLLHKDTFKADPWLWDQDWSTQELKLKKTATKDRGSNIIELDWDEEDRNDEAAEKFKYLMQLKKFLPIRRPQLPGYPAWYRKLCPRINFEHEDEEESEWCPGPGLLSPSMQITPKLLRLTWDGYPLHYVNGQGWGLLIPGKPETMEDSQEIPPIEALLKMCPIPDTYLEESSVDLNMQSVGSDVEKDLSKKDFYAEKKKAEVNKTEPTWYQGTGVWCTNVNIARCWFRRLPHPQGVHKRVGSPMARDFVTRLSEGTLRGDGADAAKVLEIGNAVSYWRNNRERVESQLVVWPSIESLPSKVKQVLRQEGSESTEFGSIIPQIVICGTLTRRAVEKTWLTASNADPKRVGSELRSMVRAPPGYHLIGADVDSQELWLSALLGDASFAGMHGATAFGWRTLQGQKNDGTDLHSATAKAAGTSRDHAKVLNYARIYGAGGKFLQQLLKRFNPGMTDEEARKTANNTMALTKGKKLFMIPSNAVKTLQELEIFTTQPSSNCNKEKSIHSPWGKLRVIGDNGEVYLNKRELLSLRQQEISFGLDMDTSPSSQAKAVWYGGTESAMFNRLEEIASNEEPSTPFLNARLSRALEPRAVGIENYLPTRVNWVVQSSAVDFLHLMLVNMRWLLGNSPDWRFLLSFHDEVRYLVPSEQKYEAALALHITNLFARAFCARRLGLHDLPRSVAYFSGVEVDLALRKDANSECITPSNPHGLSRGYGVPKGETLDVQATLQKIGPGVQNKNFWKKEEISIKIVA